MKTKEEKQANDLLLARKAIKDIANQDHITITKILYQLGYYWSNEAQCYYSTDYKLPLLTNDEGHYLANQINRFVLGNDK